jgi:glycylpeptide N-tetradecanoyltransferase
MRFELAPTFSEEDFRHWFLPQAGIVDSFVVDNGSELTGEFKLRNLS